MSISSAASGLGSFALNDDETRAYNAEIEAYEKSIGDVGGIADLGAIRARMEEMGRFGDDALAHVETGELVVPKPLLDKMPELKESILGHLRDMGVEDPERYIVGDGSNAINPETGALEFFFKSVFRGIKKAVKSVGKFLKKAAPTIITIAGAALLGPAGLGLSTIAAGAISSGIGTLVGGGSVKDALFSAAIGGATPFLSQSVGSVAAGALGGMARSAVAGGDMEDILLGGATGAGGAALGKIAGPSVKSLLGGAESTTSGLEDLTADFDKTSDFFTTASSDGLGAALQRWRKEAWRRANPASALTYCCTSCLRRSGLGTGKGTAPRSRGRYPVSLYHGRLTMRFGWRRNLTFPVPGRGPGTPLTVTASPIPGRPVVRLPVRVSYGGRCSVTACSGRGCRRTSWRRLPVAAPW